MPRSGSDSSSLHTRLSLEIFAATVSSLAVAPAIAIVDKAIVSNASGRQALLPCIFDGITDLVYKPKQFFTRPAFLLIWGVYGGTYIVANCAEAICERRNVPAATTKFFGKPLDGIILHKSISCPLYSFMQTNSLSFMNHLASSMANVSLSVAKDNAYARMFGAGSSLPMSWTSLGLFSCRDSATILASFTLPPIVSKFMQKHFSGSFLGNVTTADTCAQLLTPVSMQILSTPLHLLGLDLYNRPNISIRGSKFIDKDSFTFSFRCNNSSCCVQMQSKLYPQSIVYDSFKENILKQF